MMLSRDDIKNMSAEDIKIMTKEPSANSRCSDSAGYKYAVETYVVTGLLEMRDNLKSKRKWREVDDLNDLIDRMHKGENILL